MICSFFNIIQYNIYLNSQNELVGRGAKISKPSRHPLAPRPPGHYLISQIPAACLNIINNWGCTAQTRNQASACVMQLAKSKGDPPHQRGIIITKGFISDDGWWEGGGI